MALFKKVHYHEETQTVDLGPGKKWDDVYPILNPYGRTVAGASSCRGVGVPGFNLGGGYSNKTNQFGLAIDSIRAIEVVLPTGIILPVSESSDKELFWALKVHILPPLKFFLANSDTLDREGETTLVL